jgi:ATP-dependent Zn protease
MTTEEANGNGDSRGSGRRWVLWIAVFSGIILLVLFREKAESRGDFISQYQFEQLVENGQIARATIIYDEQKPLNEIVGQYYKEQNDQKVAVPFRTTVRLTQKLESRLLGSPNFDLRQPNKMLVSVIWSVLPILVIAVFIWFFFIRQIRMASKTSPALEQRIAKEVEQQNRFDKVLDRWEQQADRMDAILDRGEQAAREKK